MEPEDNTSEIINGDLEAKTNFIDNMNSSLSGLIDALTPDITHCLHHLDDLPIHDWNKTKKQLTREFDVNKCFDYDEIPCVTDILWERDMFTGEIIGDYEYSHNPFSIATEMTMQRPPMAPKDSVRGSLLSHPFLSTNEDDEILKKIKESSASLNNHVVNTGDTFLGEEFYLLPPNMDEVVIFNDDGCTPVGLQNAKEIKAEGKVRDLPLEDADAVNEMAKMESRLAGLWSDNEKKESPSNQEDQTADEVDELSKAPLVMKEIPVLRISDPSQKTALKASEWAQELDVTKDIDEFKNKVSMAMTFPFELDSFQKLAIMKLEENSHILVAAHTSAGKTVVADYAIALSKARCTRTIYTSPIKAISNQKYKDFRNQFPDVGLITGDSQINPDASCLVMTTEILQSMLRRGSDIVRDLEYVIFDEVHYINNSERGHVWEEVIIMLPQHVTIIMLSATVPNAIQFADWVGRTKKKKVYVVSTTKRPTPLCHHLYTGSGASTKSQKFLILDENNKFVEEGYKEAYEVMKKKSSWKRNYGPKKTEGNLTDNQESTLWIALLDHLSKEEKLPVVAFTFSRQRCDDKAANLQAVDLTTSLEKNTIKMTYKRMLLKLKENDRMLPQIKAMEIQLLRGIGVHHSGILPILKEVVEILFQQGLVKVLFATETFAMGVNMPAKTVVFSEIRKFDGQCVRNLLPAEYIQMAGRAGRRGLDKTGTVLILCSKDLYHLTDLKSMMLGKPTVLSSQFRLTYSMMLTLLRTPSMSVESMIQRSFCEIYKQGQLSHYQKELNRLTEIYENLYPKELAPHQKKLAEFCSLAFDCVAATDSLLPTLLGSPMILKHLEPGRVLIITNSRLIKQPAMVLPSKGVRMTLQGKVLPLKVLVLKNYVAEHEGVSGNQHYHEAIQSPLWWKVLSYTAAHSHYGCSAPTEEHEIISIAYSDVVAVLKATIKVKYEHVVKDYEMRQMPRFADAPIGETCKEALQDLMRFSLDVHLNPGFVSKLNILRDFKLYQQIVNREAKLNDLKQCTDIANFGSEFALIFGKQKLHDEIATIKYNLSDESLALYPEYMSRLEILRKLKYIASNNTVCLKGFVACQMSCNELLLTELIFQNSFMALEAADIAGLLSSLVYQNKTKENQKDEIPPHLLNAVEETKRIAKEINFMEARYGIISFQSAEVNFGLVKVVRDWALKESFSKIMKESSVQEGDIVRCIQQLHEVLMKVKEAAITVGDPSLQSKMEEAATAIKRDIVFAASLYTEEL